MREIVVFNYIKQHHQAKSFSCMGEGHCGDQRAIVVRSWAHGDPLTTVRLPLPKHPKHGQLAYGPA